MPLRFEEYDPSDPYNFGDLYGESYIPPESLSWLQLPSGPTSLRQLQELEAQAKLARGEIPRPRPEPEPEIVPGGIYTDFEQQVREVAMRLGGQVVRRYEEGRTQRVHFQKADAWLDITLGPGGLPILGREKGWLIEHRLKIGYGDVGPEVPQEISAWDVLGGVLQKAIAKAERMDPIQRAQEFSASISEQLGLREAEEGQALGAFYLPAGWETKLSAGALKRLGGTYAAEAVPPSVFREVFGHEWVPVGEPHGGLQAVARYRDIAGATFAGYYRAGGAGKQMGVSPYEMGRIGEAEILDMPMAGGEMARVYGHEVVVPLTGAIGAGEGMVTVPKGTTVQFEGQEKIPLVGWTAQEFAQITGLREGAWGRGGTEIPVLKGREGEILESFRRAHADIAQITRARIGLPEGSERTTWWQGLTPEEQRMYEIGAAEIVGGRPEPTLIIDYLERSAAGAAVSIKNLAFKDLVRERQISQHFWPAEGAALPPAESIYFEEAPKEPYSFYAAIGHRLGILQEGERLVSPEGVPNRELVERVVRAVAKGTQLMEYTDVVPAIEAYPYLSGRVPGVIETKWTDEGLWFRQQYLAYTGPAGLLTRQEYPKAQGTIKGEELAYIRQEHPEMYEQIKAAGYLPEAHIAVTRSFYMSHRGMLEPEGPVVSLEEVRQRLGSLGGRDINEIMQSLAESEYGRSLIQTGETYLPSPQTMQQLSATNVRGLEVSPYIHRYMDILAGAGAEGWTESVAELITSPGWIRNLETVRVPSVTTPGTAASGVPIGEAHAGVGQFRKLAREIFRHEPSPGELQELRRLFERESIVDKAMRFPASDVETQNELYLRMRISQEVGANELVLNPVVQALLRGDADAEFYRQIASRFAIDPETGTVMRDDEGNIIFNKTPAGPQLTEARAGGMLYEMIANASPEALREAQGRVANWVEQLRVEGYAPEVIRQLELGAILAETDYFANEIHKRFQKQTAISAEGDPYDIMMRDLTDPKTGELRVRRPWHEREKALAGYEAKGFMGRIYEAMIRDTSGRASAEVISLVRSAAANMYQGAIDLGKYQQDLPLGRVRGGDPYLSHGYATMLEAMSSQSLMGSGYAQSITGKLKYSTEIKTWEQVEDYWVRNVGPGYQADWMDYKQNPIMSLGQTLGRMGAFTGELTKEQIAALLTGETGRADVTTAVEEARWYIESQGGKTAEEILKTRGGFQMVQEILEASGLASEEEIMTSEAPWVTSLRDKALIRAHSQYMRALYTDDEDYRKWALQKWNWLGERAQMLTGKHVLTLYQEAVARQESIDIHAGRVQGKTAIERAEAMARTDLPDYVLKGVRPYDPLDIDFSKIEPIPFETDEPPVSGVQEVSEYYKLPLEELGVTAARVLSPREFLRGVKGFEHVDELTEEQIGTIFKERGGFAGYTRGTEITVRGLTASEQARWGDRYDLNWIMRTRLAHEAGHARFETLTEEAKDALRQEFEAMSEDDPFIQDLKILYPDRWQEAGPSELLAHHVARELTGHPGILGHRTVEEFEEEMLELASAGGEGGIEGPPVMYAAAPSAPRGPGSNWMNIMRAQLARDLGPIRTILETLTQQLTPSDEPFHWTPEAYGAAFRIAAGEQGVLQEEQFARLAISTKPETQAEFYQLSRLEKMFEKGEASTTWDAYRFYRSMASRESMYRDPQASMGVSPEVVSAGMGRMGQLLQGDVLKAYAEQAEATHEWRGREIEWERARDLARQELAQEWTGRQVEWQRGRELAQEEGAYEYRGRQIEWGRERELGRERAAHEYRGEQIAWTRARDIARAEQAHEYRGQEIAWQRTREIAQEEGAHEWRGREIEWERAREIAQAEGAYEYRGRQIEWERGRILRQEEALHEQRGEELMREYTGRWEEGRPLREFNESLTETKKTLDELNQVGGRLNQTEKDRIEVQEKGRLLRDFEAAFRAEGVPFMDRPGAQEAAQILGIGGGDGGGGFFQNLFGALLGGGRQGPLGVFEGGLGEGITGSITRSLSGMGLFTQRRLWSLFGAPAIQAEQVAAQQEMAAMGAVAAWTGGGEMGPVSGGLLNIAATQQAMQARMGQGAFMAYGGLQQWAASQGGEMLGVLGPAVAAGAMTMFATRSPLLGVGVGLGALAYGGLQYAGAVASDEVESAYRMALRAERPEPTPTFWTHLADWLGGGGRLGVQAPGGGWEEWAQAFNLGLEPGEPSMLPTTPEERAERLAYGRLITGGQMGALEGDRAAQLQALEHWALRQVEGGSFLTQQKLMEMGGEWQAWTGDIANLYGVPEGAAGAGGAGRVSEGLPRELFEGLAARGITIQQVGELAFGIGGTTQTMQPLAEALVAAPRSIAAQRALQQYGVLGQAGWVDPTRLIEELPELQEMTTRQQSRLAQMVQGDRYMFSRYGAGQGLGLPSKAMEYIQEQWGGPADWMVTMEVDTGLPLYTTTGEGYSGAYGALETPAARMAGTRGIQWAQFALNRDYQQFQIGQQWNQMQLGYTMQTGQMMPGENLPGTVTPAFQQMAAGIQQQYGTQYGGMWGLEDAANILAYQQNMYGFQYQLGQLGMQRAQFGEDWQAKWSQFQIQRGWEEEQERRTRERNVAADEWWLDRWGYQENVAQLQYGWSMEDLDEQIRFATGRRKLQLERQKERTTISESMRREQHEEERDYWEKTRDWREEDLDTQRSHREQINEWREEDMLRQKRHYEESADAQEDHIHTMMGFYQDRKQIEDDRIKLQRMFWQEQQEANKIALQEWQRVSALQNQYRADEMRLLQDREDKSARFSVIVAELGENLGDAAKAAAVFQAALREISRTSGGGGTTSGGGYAITPEGDVVPKSPDAGGFNPSRNPAPFNRPPVDQDRDGKDDETGIPITQWFWYGWPTSTVIMHAGGPVHAQRMHGGGPAGLLPGETGAILEEGEYVVPKGGTLVMQENERTVILLEKILFAIEDQGGKITFLVNNPEKAANTYGQYLDAAYNYR